MLLTDAWLLSKGAIISEFESCPAGCKEEPHYVQLLADVLTVGKYVRAGKNVDMLVGRIRRRLPDIPVGEARVAVESYLERVVAPLNKG